MTLPRFTYLYVFWTPAHAYSAKIGISDDWRRRKTEVAYALNTRVYALPLPVLYARQCEAMFHRLFRRLRRRNMPDHSGQSEWFWSLNLIAACLLYLLMRYMGRDDASGWFIAALVIPAPLDYALCVVVFAILQWGAVVGVLWWAAVIVF